MSTLAPTNHVALSRFGKGDERKRQRYLLMLAAFLEGRSPDTKRTYACGLRQFFELFEWICPEDVTPAHAAAFKKWLLERRKVSEATTCNRMSAVSSFFEFLCKPADTSGEPLLQSNPFRHIPRYDIAPTPYATSRAMSWETFRQIYEALPTDPLGLRDKAILLFFAFTGRRRGEVANLRIRDLRLGKKPPAYTCRVKGGRVKEFELPSICYKAIKAYWIASDRLNYLEADDAVFAPDNCQATRTLKPGLDFSQPLTRRSMNRILQRAARRAGVDPKDPTICIHAIRHMAAGDLDRAGIRLQDIQAFLGHASPVTTQVYIERLRGPAAAHTEALMKVREEAAGLGRALFDSEDLAPEH